VVGALADRRYFANIVALLVEASLVANLTVNSLLPGKMFSGIVKG
jgi:hypothetical protein